MIHKVKSWLTQTVMNEYYVAPCIGCDCDDINVNEYEDKYGYITTLTCKGCKSEIKINEGLKGGIDEWNNKNDINILIASKTIEIDDLKNEIKGLKTKLKKKK